MPNLLRTVLNVEEATFGRVFRVKTVKTMGKVVLAAEVMHRLHTAWDEHQLRKSSVSIQNQNDDILGQSPIIETSGSLDIVQEQPTETFSEVQL